MPANIEPFAEAPQIMKAWVSASREIIDGVEPEIAELVEIRASQINGCANCLNMHSSWARDRGESEQRITLLAAWRDAPCYTDRERAALGWTEALTRLSEGRSVEGARQALQKHFTDQKQVKLTMLIISINGWNRLSVGLGLWVEPAAAAAILKAA